MLFSPIPYLGGLNDCPFAGMIQRLVILAFCLFGHLRPESLTQQKKEADLDKIKVRPEDENAMAELRKAEKAMNFKELEASEVLLPHDDNLVAIIPGQANYKDKQLLRPQPFSKADYIEMGPVEYNEMLQSMFFEAEQAPTSVDPYVLFESMLSAASASQFRSSSSTSSTSSSSSSFSYSFASETSSTYFTFSTTATPPSPTNTVVENIGRPQAYHSKNATSYMIGALIPLSVNGSGLLGGVQFTESFKCAINIVNSNSRILKNTLLTYLIQDTEALPSVSSNQAFFLNRRDLSMVVGPFEYDSLPPVANLYNNVSLPFISYGAAGVQYSNGTQYPSFFRTIPSDVSTARAMAESFKLFGWNFVAAIFTTDSYGQSGRSALLQQIGRQRLKVTCVNQIDPGSVRGLANFADCVAQSDASVVVLWMDEINAANTLSYLYRNASNSRLTFVASDRWALMNNPASFNDTLPRTNYSFPVSFIEGNIMAPLFILITRNARICSANW